MHALLPHRRNFHIDRKRHVLYVIDQWPLTVLGADVTAYEFVVVMKHCSKANLCLIFYLGYFRFRALRTKKLNQVHIHLCVSLLVGYLTFLIGVERPRLYAPCLAITAVLQFAFLSAWGWMVTEFFVMYRSVRSSR